MIPDGYNTIPHSRYYEEITGKLNMAGNIFYVDSGSGSDSDNGESWEDALATIDAAIGKCTANNGDIIFVAPGHAETLATASAIAVDVAGVSIYGVGNGNDRPKITIGTLAAACITISAASVTLKNIIVIGALDGLDSAINVTGDDPDIDIEYRDTSATVEANIAITLTGVDRGKIKLNYIGFIAGNAVTNAIVMDGCTSCDVDVAFYGIASAAIVEFTGHACHNININGYFYNSGTTNLTKNVVDTITGSTWSAKGFDGAAGCSFSGGSGAALAKDDVSAVTTLLSNIDKLLAADGAGNFPASAADQSIISKILSKVAGGDTSSFDNTTDSLEAISDAIAYIKNNLVVATGTFTTSSATVPADTSLAAKATGYYNGCILLPLTGNCMLQPRKIALFTTGTGVFTLESETPFTEAPGLVTYVILAATPIVGLNTIVPATPTAGSLYDILSKAAGGNTFNKATDSLEAIADMLLGVTTNAPAIKREAGRTQVFEKNITAAANAGVTTVGTITTQGVVIEKVILKSNGATTADLTSAAVKGGAGAVIEFIDAATAVKASIDADDEQLKYDGAVALDATKTIIIDLQGTGATAVDLDVIVVYRAIADGGYIA